MIVGLWHKHFYTYCMCCYAVTHTHTHTIVELNIPTESAHLTVKMPVKQKLLLDFQKNLTWPFLKEIKFPLFTLLTHWLNHTVASLRQWYDDALFIFSSAYHEIAE